MAVVHHYPVRSSWTGDRHGQGLIDGKGMQQAFSIPANLNGPDIGSSPEEMLVSAAASCYLITLALLLTNRKIPYVRIDLESEGSVIDDRGLRFDRIEHRPTIVVDVEVDEQQIVTLAEHAEHACMISSAIRGNVAVTVTPTVVTASPQS